jgi:ParB family chromosome partitioning protein
MGKLSDFVKTTNSAIEWISLDLIDESSFQPRTYFDPSKITQLEISIKAMGNQLAEPLLVRRKPEGRYELVTGGRRLKACQNMQLQQINCVVIDVDDNQFREIAIASNLLREDLNPVEETHAILDLLSLRLGCDRKIITAHLHKLHNSKKATREQDDLEEKIGLVFELVGMTYQSFYKNRLPLLTLDPIILASIEKGLIAYTTARAIAGVKDSVIREKLLEDAIAGASHREILEKIKSLNPVLPVQKQLDDVLKKTKKSQVWNDPEKVARIESLIEKLIQELDS